MADLTPIEKRYLYLSNIIVTLLYAFEFFLAINTILVFLRNHTRSRRRNFSFITYVSLILLTQTLFVICWLVTDEKMLVEGGTGDDGWNIAGSGFVFVTELLEILLVLYRCYVIWSSNRRIIVLPVLMFFGAIGLALTAIIRKGTSAYYSDNSFLLICVLLVTVLNGVLTTLISLRLILAQRKLTRAGITSTLSRSKSYASIVTILVETSLLFCVLGVILSVTLAKNLSSHTVFLAIWAVYAGIAPILILYRVAKGIAYQGRNEPTTHVVSDIRFEGAIVSAENSVGGDITCGTEATTPRPPLEDLKDLPLHSNAV